MKTREKILQASLLLFNDEGESHVTTVDIANEIDISPGNLYYHFKGKEAIVEELFFRFEQEMSEILAKSDIESLSVEDYWLYIYVLFEEICNYRFLYQNIGDIMRRYDKIQRPFARLLKLKSSTAQTLCEELATRGILQFCSQAELNALVKQIVMTVVYWVNFNGLIERGQNSNPAVLMHQGVFQIMALIAPHLANHQKYFFKECMALFTEAINKVESETV